jgi:hypothetical protein
MALRIHAKPTDNALHGLLARECIDRNAENGNAGCHDQQYPRKRWRAQSLLPTLSRGMSRFIILGRTAVIACVLLSACAVQTGPAPQTPDADTLSSQPEAQHASSDAGAESSAAAAEEVVADPPATTTDSLEVPATQQEFRALTGSDDACCASGCEDRVSASGVCGAGPVCTAQADNKTQAITAVRPRMMKRDIPRESVGSSDCARQRFLGYCWS